MDATLATYSRRLVEYDALRRRLWILGQRCHHGATGSLVTAAASVALVIERATNPSLVAIAATGGLMMAHDWKDKAIWFERGRGTQL